MRLVFASSGHLEEPLLAKLSANNLQRAPKPWPKRK
jgi:hypothetical protein